MEDVSLFARTAIILILVIIPQVARMLLEHLMQGEVGEEALDIKGERHKSRQSLGGIADG